MAPKARQGQGKPPGLIEHTGQEQAGDASEHEDRILAAPGGVLLSVGRFRGRDENGGIASLAAVFMLIPRAFTSRSDYSRPPYFFALAAALICCLCSRTLASESASVTSAIDW